MPRPTRRSRREIAIIVLLVVSAVMIVLDHRGRFAAEARSVAVHLFAPSQSWLKNFTLSLVGGPPRPQLRGKTAQDRIDELHAELGVSEMERATLTRERDDLKKMLREIKQIVAGLPGYPLRLVPANVLSRQYLLPERGLKLDAGRRQGVGQGHLVFHPFISQGKSAGIKVDDPVLSGKGLVGIIGTSANDYSQVLPLTSPKCILPAQIMHWDPDTGWVSQGKVGHIEGSGDGKTLTLKYITKDVLVAPGDFVVTAATKAGLPDYVVIGEVTEVSHVPGGDGTLHIVVKPRVNLDHLDQVYVLSPRGSPR